MLKHVESYSKDWVGPLRSNRKVSYANKEMRVDALEERIDKEAIYNLFLWVGDQPERDLDGLMEEIDNFFIHSEGGL